MKREQTIRKCCYVTLLEEVESKSEKKAFLDILNSSSSSDDIATFPNNQKRRFSDGYWGQMIVDTDFCMGLSSTRTMSSDLEGIPMSTSAFRRRSMWGPSRECSFWIWSSFEISANSEVNDSRSLKNDQFIRTTERREEMIRTINSRPDWAFCQGKYPIGYLFAVLMMTYKNRVGSRKLSRWKSSSRLFCSGVPVSRRR